MAATLDLAYVATYGYVSFEVRTTPAGYTVKRVAAGGSLVPIAGFEDSSWVDGSGAGYGEDYRPPMGATVTYVVCPVDATGDDPGYVRGSVITPAEAWLRDVSTPQLSHRVTVVNTDDESLPAFQHIYDVSGRRLPLVVHDIRQGRHGSVVLWAGTPADRMAIENLLATGNPLLLALCADALWPACMMAIGDATFARQGTEAKWFVRLDYVEVDDPLRMAGDRITAVSWTDIVNGYPQRPGDPSPVTWNWLVLSYLDWLAVVGGDRKP
jgi:hypothetical protein